MVVGKVMDNPKKDYYEMLGIEKTAASEEIKRAYFGKVRQYPPERFSEEFKEIRAAYETLSDKEKRTEYDEIGALPEAILPLLYRGRNANNRGQHDKAAECYETILRLHPELDKIRQEYARTLEDDGKTGKAIETWEYLCAQCPANVEYAVALAESYGHRGWGKKALAQYQRALELDKSNSDSWLSFIHYHIDADELKEAEALCTKALDTVGEKATMALHLCAFVLFGPSDKTFAEECLQNIVRKAKETLLDEDNFETTLLVLINRVEDEESIQFYPYVKEFAALLPRMDDDLRERLGWAERNYDITNIENKGFDSLLYDILLIRNNYEEDSPKIKKHLITMECVLLSKKDKYYPLLGRLKAEYPNLYDLHKTFFDEALATKNPESMIRHRKKSLDKQHLRLVSYMEDEEDEEDCEPVETFRRESPKIGRNAPCPCGSGKKYKKCCGA